MFPRPKADTRVPTTPGASCLESDRQSQVPRLPPHQHCGSWPVQRSVAGSCSSGRLEQGRRLVTRQPSTRPLCLFRKPNIPGPVLMSPTIGSWRCQTGNRSVFSRTPWSRWRSTPRMEKIFHAFIHSRRSFGAAPADKRDRGTPISGAGMCTFPQRDPPNPSPRGWG